MSQADALLAEWRAGSREAFESIFQAYYGQVFALAYRLLGSADEAEEVAQDAFLRLYQHPLPAGRQHNLQGWLLRVAANLGYNVLRSRRRRLARERPAPDDQEWADLAGSGDPAEHLAQAEVAARVRGTLAALSERQVQFLLLRHAGLSYNELAAALDVAPSSVGTLLARAERAFRQHYGELEAMEKDVPSDPLS